MFNSGKVDGKIKKEQMGRCKGSRCGENAHSHSLLTPTLHLPSALFLFSVHSANEIT